MQEKGHVASECDEELPKTSGGNKGTSLFIKKEESSDEELRQDGHYESNDDNREDKDNQDVTSEEAKIRR